MARWYAAKRHDGHAAEFEDLPGLAVQVRAVPPPHCYAPFRGLIRYCSSLSNRVENEVGIAGDFSVRGFQSNELPQAGVFGLVNDAHGATAKFAVDFILTKFGQHEGPGHLAETGGTVFARANAIASFYHRLILCKHPK